MNPSSSGRGVKRRREEDDNVGGVVSQKELNDFLYNDESDYDNDDGSNDSRDKPLTGAEIGNIINSAKEDDDYDDSTTDDEPDKQVAYSSNFDRPDDVEITPFNLDEELEEGAFHESGTFVFHKNKDETKDQWADTIDWDEVRKKESVSKTIDASSSNVNQRRDKDTEEIFREPPKDKIYFYKQMLRFIKPNETVQKAIRRLGNQIPKKGRPVPSNAKDLSAENLAELRRKLDLMIELAHQCLEEGDVNIYQRTFDELEEAIDV